MVDLKGEPKARYVAAMFGRIAPRYDRLNTVMTAGMHHRWRRLATRLAMEGLEGEALDVATGTGDLALALLRQPGVRRAVALDFVPEMLRLARKKARRQGMEDRVELVQGDALRLPFPDGRYACATSGFGLRNVGDLAAALREMARVVRPGGRVVILELSMSGVWAPLRRGGPLVLSPHRSPPGDVVGGGTGGVYLPARVGGCLSHPRGPARAYGHLRNEGSTVSLRGTGDGSGSRGAGGVKGAAQRLVPHAHLCYDGAAANAVSLFS